MSKWTGFMYELYDLDYTGLCGTIKHNEKTNKQRLTEPRTRPSTMWC